jgi:hypothetical protein
MLTVKEFNETINTPERKSAKEKMLQELEVNKDVTKIESTDGTNCTWYITPKQTVLVESNGKVSILEDKR